MRSQRDEAPPGWERNPTARPKRHRIAALALGGLCISAYLTLYQLNVLPHVWDPFFGDGSVRVLAWTHPYPRSVKLVDELPETATGKILRRELRPAHR